MIQHSNSTIATAVLQSIKERESNSRKVYNSIKEGYPERYPKAWRKYVAAMAEKFSADAEAINSLSQRDVCAMAGSSEEIYQAILPYSVSVKKLGKAILAYLNVAHPQWGTMEPLITAMVDYAQAISLLLEGLFHARIYNNEKEACS